MPKLLPTLILSLLLLNLTFLSSCAGKGFSFHPNPTYRNAAAFNSQTTTVDDAEKIDRQFKVGEDVTAKEDLNTKAGYIILGIAGVALTVAAIALPVYLATK